jgi:hypothetical protein
LGASVVVEQGAVTAKSAAFVPPIILVRPVKLALPVLSRVNVNAPENPESIPPNTKDPGVT